MRKQIFGIRSGNDAKLSPAEMQAIESKVSRDAVCYTYGIDARLRQFFAFRLLAELWRSNCHFFTSENVFILSTEKWEDG